jgi:hypothetical protein
MLIHFAFTPKLHFALHSTLSPITDVALCNFCDGGSIRGDTLIPDQDGITCERALEIVATEESSSENCAAAQYAEALCCPSKASTCSICKGADLREDVVVPGSDGMTCVEVAYFVAEYEMTSANCTLYQDLEAFCCPDPDIHSKKCYLCGEDGFGSINDDVQAPGEKDGWTCGMEAQWVVQYDADSDQCVNLQSGAEDICCPSSTAIPTNGDMISSSPRYASSSYISHAAWNCAYSCSIRCVYYFLSSYSTSPVSPGVETIVPTYVSRR